MPKLQELTPVERSLITLINNANDLIMASNRRTDARDVMKALKVYAKNKNYPIPEEQIDNFLAVLLDCRQNTLSYLLTDIALTISNQQ